MERRAPGGEEGICSRGDVDTPPACNGDEQGTEIESLVFIERGCISLYAVQDGAGLRKSTDTYYREMEEMEEGPYKYSTASKKLEPNTRAYRKRYNRMNQ